MHIRLDPALTAVITSAAVSQLSPPLTAPQPPLRPQSTGISPPPSPPRPPSSVAPAPIIPLPLPPPNDRGASGGAADGNVAAIGGGDEVPLRALRSPWPARSTTRRRVGARAHLTFPVVANMHGPTPPGGIPWTEVCGPVDGTGTWPISGAVPSPGGDRGWIRTYAFHRDGNDVLTEYPPWSHEGRWQVGWCRVCVIFDGATSVVALARPPAARRAHRPRARTHVQVPLEPRSSERSVPRSRVEVETDDAAQVSIGMPANIAGSASRSPTSSLSSFACEAAAERRALSGQESYHALV